MRKSTFLQFTIICLFVIIALGSSNNNYPGSSDGGWDGSVGQQAVQHVVQGANGGTYIGNASSESEAKRMTGEKGYDAYIYYPSTGEVFGY